MSYNNWFILWSSIKNKICNGKKYDEDFVKILDAKFDFFINNVEYFMNIPKIIENVDIDAVFYCQYDNKTPIEWYEKNGKAVIIYNDYEYIGFKFINEYMGMSVNDTEKLFDEFLYCYKNSSKYNTFYNIEQKNSAYIDIMIYINDLISRVDKIFAVCENEIVFLLKLLNYDLANDMCKKSNRNYGFIKKIIKSSNFTYESNINTFICNIFILQYLNYLIMILERFVNYNT